MGFLEEKINRILQLRQTPKEQNVGEIDTIPEQAEYYDSLVRRRIEEHISMPPYPLGALAWRLDMSVETLRDFFDYHSLKYHEDRWFTRPARRYGRRCKKPKAQRLQDIRDAITQGGARSYEEIADLTGLTTGTVQGYCYWEHVSLPGKGRTKSYRPRQQFINQLRELLVENKYTRREIAEKMKLSLHTINTYASKEKIKLPKQKKKTLGRGNQNINQIRELVQEGKYTRQEIADKVGLALSTMQQYASKAQIRLPRTITYQGKMGRGRKEDYPFIAKTIQEILGEQERSLETLCTKVDVGLDLFHRICKEYNIILPEDIIPWKARPEIDVWVEQGLTLEEIGGKVDLTRERVRQYIQGSGQYKEYREKREEMRKQKILRYTKTALKQQRRELLSPIKQQLAQRAVQESWPVRKVVEYELLRTKQYPGQYNVQQLLSLFTAYDEAAQQGNQLTLQDLAQKSGIRFPGVGKVLWRVGLEPMSGGHYRRKGEQLRQHNAMIDRLADSDLSPADVGYFANEWENQIERRWQKIGVQKKRKILHQTGHHKLTYRLASQIYEAEDLGFSHEENAELHDKGPKLIEFALKHRDEIARKIKHALRIIYPIYAQEICTPYLTTPVKKKIKGANYA